MGQQQSTPIILQNNNDITHIESICTKSSKRVKCKKGETVLISIYHYTSSCVLYDRYRRSITIHLNNRSPTALINFLKANKEQIIKAFLLDDVNINDKESIVNNGYIKCWSTFLRDMVRANLMDRFIPYLKERCKMWNEYQHHVYSSRKYKIHAEEKFYDRCVACPECCINMYNKMERNMVANPTPLSLFDCNIQEEHGDQKKFVSEAITDFIILNYDHWCECARFDYDEIRANKM